MTHDELVDIAIVKDLNKLIRKQMKAIDTVFELHKPVSKTDASVFSSSHSDDGQRMVTRTYCEECNYRYPCKTIQAIEKELA